MKHFTRSDRSILGQVRGKYGKGGGEGGREGKRDGEDK